MRSTVARNYKCATIRKSEDIEADGMASSNVVNLDALIRRADLAAPGEASEDITSLSVMGLAPKGFLYPASRSPTSSGKRPVGPLSRSPI
jgi:hypothetical protein